MLCVSHMTFTSHGVCVGESEGNLWELVLSFPYVGSRDGTQVVKLRRKPNLMCLAPNQVYAYALFKFQINHVILSVISHI